MPYLVTKIQTLFTSKPVQNIERRVMCIPTSYLFFMECELISDVIDHVDNRI